MYIPVSDDRYFTSGTDNNLLQEIPLYEPEQYEEIYAKLSTIMPEMFSINLKEEIMEFTTTAPIQFEIAVDHVIDLACYYYCDWDSVVAVTDEFLHAEIKNKVMRSLTLAHYDTASADAMMQDLIVMLSEALQKFINAIIGVLSRTSAPAIMEYGCCYRLNNIDHFGNVFFILKNPTQVYSELEGDEVPR